MKNVNRMLDVPVAFGGTKNNSENDNVTDQLYRDTLTPPWGLMLGATRRSSAARLDDAVNMYLS